MNQAIDFTDAKDAAAGTSPSMGCNDPLLQELWAAKARMNAESGYSVERRAAQSRAFDLDATLTRLRQLATH